MAIPFVLMAAGTALQVAGQYQANMAQAKAELQNADYYRAQADFVRQAQFRQADITAREYTARKGLQVSAYAKGNVDLSGSAATVVAATLAEQVEELTAIKQKGELDYKLAIMRSRQSTQQAETLSSFEYNFFQSGGTLLSGLARASDNGRNSPVAAKEMGHSLGGGKSLSATDKSPATPAGYRPGTGVAPGSYSSVFGASGYSSRFGKVGGS